MNRADTNYLMGIFDDEDKLMAAGKKLQDENVDIYDIFTPFPVHGLDALLKIKRSRLPIVTFFAACTGCVAAMYFQYWVSAVSWPINVGGKPFNSFMAFIPVGFEITILFGALLTVAAFFWKVGLYPGKKGNIPHLECTDDKFILVVECIDAGVDTDEIEKSLMSQGALEVEIKRGSQWE